MTATTQTPTQRRAEAQRVLSEAREQFLRSVADDPMARSFLTWVAAARDLDAANADVAYHQDARLTPPPATAIPSFEDAVRMAIVTATQAISGGEDWPPATE